MPSFNFSFFNEFTGKLLCMLAKRDILFAIVQIHLLPDSVSADRASLAQLTMPERGFTVRNTMHKLTSIIFLLVFTLLIQNTCPLGAAGKTKVAASCHNCPSKLSVSVSPDGQGLVSGSSSIHFPLYVFAVAKTIHTFQLELLKTTRPILAGCYKDALPDLLLRPPRA